MTSRLEAMVSALEIAVIQVEMIGTWDPLNLARIEDMAEARGRMAGLMSPMIQMEN